MDAGQGYREQEEDIDGQGWLTKRRKDLVCGWR